MSFRSKKCDPNYVSPLALGTLTILVHLTSVWLSFDSYFLQGKNDEWSPWNWTLTEEKERGQNPLKYFGKKYFND